MQSEVHPLFLGNSIQEKNGGLMSRHLLLINYLAETLSPHIVQPLSVFSAVSRIWWYLLKCSCTARKGVSVSGNFS